MRFPWCAAALLVSLGCALPVPLAASQEEPDRSRGPVPPPARRAEWTQSPGPWEPLESSIIRAGSGTRWKLTVGRRVLGTLQSGRTDVPVYLPRMQVKRIAHRDTSTVAVLLPTDNRDVALFPPGSPEESAIPSEPTQDAWGRWPNPCGFSLLDATGHLDLDHDGVPEAAIRRFCACPASACSGIIFVELNDKGPTLLDPASLVREPRLGRLVVERMDASGDSSRPVLAVAPDFLEGCRFIAMLGVRGEAECPDCCRIPVLLRALSGGGYEVFSDRAEHSRWLQKAEDDLSYVASGNPGEPLHANEEARIARAAAVLYLTGSGAQTHQIISQAIEKDRGPDFRLEILLRRLDELFLASGDGVR